MDAGFIKYLAEERGFQPGDTIATKQQYDALYKEYLKGGSGGFQPSAMAVTNPVNTNQVIPVLTTSPNSVQPFPQTRPQYKPDKDGNLLAIEGTTASYVTNNTGERIKVDPKSNRFEDLMLALGQNEAPAPEESPGILSRIFGGVPATNAPTATPTPPPMATPAAAQGAAATMTGGPGTSRPTYATPDDVRAAWKAGKLSDEQAVRMLRGGR